MKWLSLIVLFFQNGLTPIFFRLATTGATQDARYNVATSVVFQELVKLFASCILLTGEEGWVFSRSIRVIRTEVFGKPVETLKLAVPAVLYFVQNNLLQLASSNLPAAVFQVTYQGKTLVVAMFSIFLLNKVLTRAKWFSLGLMASGLAVVQLSKSKETKQADMANSEEQSISLGLFMVLMGCFCSGFAGVYFEKMMKKPTSSSQGNKSAAPAKKPSMWVRNIQLAAFSVLIGAYPAFFGGSQSSPDGILHGFTTPVWIMVFNNAFGGLCVAAVIKYADNIWKGFACALATVLSCIVAIPLFGFTISFLFFVGTVIVISSTLIYGGTIKLHDPWWDEEPSLCTSMRAGATSGPKAPPLAQEEEGRLLKSRGSGESRA